MDPFVSFLDFSYYTSLVRGVTTLLYHNILLVNKEYPSWGYSIINGATTIWERWDSYVEGYGVNSHGMNSFNHFAFGTVIEWLYEYALGIKPQTPAFDEVVFSPQIDFSGKITDIKGSYFTGKNKISVKWYVDEDKAFVEIDSKLDNVKIDLKKYNIIDEQTQNNKHCFILKSKSIG